MRLWRRRHTVMDASTVLRGLGEQVLDFVFPPQCAGCQREGAYVCAPCLAQVRWLDAPYRPNASGATGAIEVRAIYAPFAMEGAVRQAVHQLKYDGVRAIAATLAEAMASCARGYGLTADVLAPVPLHQRRLRERGYNQAVLLAREVGQRLGIAVDARALERVAHGQPQARSGSVQERWAQVREAFAARGDVAGKQVVVVDDVCTTGATINACASALREAGAAVVWGLTAAREL